MKIKCVWDDWNREHIAKHHVSEREAEYVLDHAKPPYPRDIGLGKHLVRGQTSVGRFLQVIFATDADKRIDYENMSFEDIIGIADDDVPRAYVVHARELNAREKFKLRRH